MTASFLTPREAARTLGITREHCYRMIRTGKLPSTRRYGRILIRRSVAERMAAEGWYGRGRGR